jgi:tetratricopeptide (TPR) repeat protein
MNKYSLSSLLASILLVGCSVEQPKLQVSSSSARAAYVRGDVKDAVVFFESEAQEAEKNAASSSFSQQYWAAASRAYVQAQRAAHLNGQLQKAIDYGTKALETAEKTKDPALEVDATHRLVYAYRDVRNFEQARQFIDRAHCGCEGETCR